METWRPPEVPRWKKIAGNWMFQLAILSALIFIIVLKDSFSDKPDTSYQESSIPVADSIPRDESENFAAPTKEKATTSKETADVTNQSSFAPTNKKLQEESPKQQAFTKQATLYIYLMNRSLIERIAERSQKLEENVFLIKSKAITQLTQGYSQERLGVGRKNANFQLGQESTLFVGETDADSELKLGFFLQLNVSANSTYETLQYEVNYWHQLQLNNAEGPRSTFEINSPTDSALVILDPSVHDISFSQEERTLFDSSRSLSRLNEESLQEGLSDIVLVLKIK